MSADHRKIYDRFMKIYVLYNQEQNNLCQPITEKFMIDL